jgi:hypothetical protein
VVAHPWLDAFDYGKRDGSADLDAMTAAGLDGIELWHPKQASPEVFAVIAEAVRRTGALPTPGSDDHSPNLEYVGTVGPAGPEAVALAARTRAAIARWR